MYVNLCTKFNGNLLFIRAEKWLLSRSARKEQWRASRFAIAEISIFVKEIKHRGKGLSIVRPRTNFRNTFRPPKFFTRRLNFRKVDFREKFVEKINITPRYFDRFERTTFDRFNGNRPVRIHRSISHPRVVILHRR